MYYQAVSAQKDGDLARALDLLDQTLKQDPRNHKAMARRGMILALRGSANQGYAELSRALKANPDSVQALTYRGWVGHLLGDYQRSLEDLDRAARLAPGDWQIKANRALVLNLLGRHQEALEAAQASLKLRPDNLPALTSAGRASLGLGRTKDAERYLAEALKQDGADVQTQILRAGLAKAQGHPEQALEALSKALAKDPGYGPAYLTRGGLLVEMGRSEEARADLTRAAGLLPHDPAARSALAGLGRSAPPAGEPKDATTGRPAAADTRRVSTGTPPPAEAPKADEEPEDEPVSGPLAGNALVLSSLDPREALAVAEQERAPEAERPLVMDERWSKLLEKPCRSETDPGEPAQSVPPDPATPPSVGTMLGKDINRLTKTYWAGEVSAAHQAMAMLIGPMTPEQRSAFDTIWAPLYDFPSDTAMVWLRRLNPLLVEFLARQQEVESLLEAGANQEFEAEMAAAYEQEQAAAAALNRGKDLVGRLKAAKARLEELASQVRALGPPPDVLLEKCQAQHFAKKAGVALKLAAQEKAMEGSKSGGKEPKRFWPPETVYKGPDALPKDFFDRVPSSFRGIYRSMGIFDWLVGWHPERKPEYYLTISGYVPSPVPGLSSEPVHFPGDIKDFTWKDRAFSLVLEDKGFASHKCPGDILSRCELSGRISADGRMLEKLSILKVRLGCLCGKKSGSKDCDWRTERKEFIYEFKDLPLVSVQPSMSAASPLGLTLDYAVKGDDALSHMTRLEPPSPNPTSGRSYSISFAISPRYPPKPPQAPPAPPDPKAQKIAFHKNNIAWLEKDLARLKSMRDQAADEAARLEIQYQITCKTADLQAERDAITTLETGNYTRSPTAWDAMVRNQMLAQGREMAAEIKKAQQNRDRLDRLIAALPPEDRLSMQDFVHRQLSGAPLDLKKQAEVGRVLSERVQARALQEAARQDEKAAWNQLAVDVADNYQQAAVYAMYATPFVAGGGVLAITYGIASGGITGYEQGGVKGAAISAVTTAARFWSPKIDYMITAFEGYQEGGAAGAVSKVATTYVKRLATQAVTGGLLRFQARSQAAARQTKLDSWRNAQRRTAFKQEREYGRNMVQQHHETYQRLQAAKRGGAPRAEVDRLTRELVDQTAAIKHAPHAKGYLKLTATPAEQRAYNASDRLHARQVVRDLRQDLAAQGIDPNSVRFRPMRNAGNCTPGMDLDLAMEPVSGNFVMRRDPATGQVRRMSLYDANAFVQGRFERVYANASGNRSAEASWQQVTTSANREAYADTRWLHVREMHDLGVDPRAVLDRGYAGQAASVTQFKADHMRKFTGMGRDNQNWEIYRGTRKDIDTKARPLLERKVMDARTPAERAEALKKMHFYMKLSNAMQKADQDPVAADREVRKLTGLDTNDVVNMVGAGLESLGKWR